MLNLFDFYFKIQYTYSNIFLNNLISCIFRYKWGVIYYVFKNKK